MTSKLDQIVKGAPPPGTSVPTVSSRAPSPATSSIKSEESTPGISSLPALPDSSADLASSPPQIYLNLLILEASLRAQYLTLRARRRQHNFFLFLLTLWIAWFSYLLFLRPREDGSGVGGSVYWMVEMGEKVALMGGIVTVMLMWGTGQLERGVKWPRRWMGHANRGLRSVNAKIVVIKGAWWKELLGQLSFLFPYSSFFPSTGPSYHYIEGLSEKSEHEDGDALSYEEDLSAGGDHIKLLLLPKPFSANFRENWELYRSDYWEKENVRRAKLRQALRRHARETAKKENGWLYHLGWRTPKRRLEPVIKVETEKSRHKSHGEKDGKHRHASSRSESHSRTASRSSTPSTLEVDDKATLSRSRRGSSSTATGERRRKARPSVSMEQSYVGKMTPVTRPA